MHVARSNNIAPHCKMSLLCASSPRAQHTDLLAGSLAATRLHDARSTRNQPFIEHMPPRLQSVSDRWSAADAASHLHTCIHANSTLFELDCMGDNTAATHNSLQKFARSHHMVPHCAM